MFEPSGADDDPVSADLSHLVPSFEALSRTLWAERKLVETLLFKLEVEQVLLSTGHVRWINEATAEVSAVLDEIRRLEAERAGALGPLVAELHLGFEASMGQLIEASPSPWSELFADHQVALLGLIGEVEELAARNRQILHAELTATRQFLAAVQATPVADGYSRAGRGSTMSVAGPAIFETDI